MSRSYRGDMVRVKAGGRWVSATPDHPFFVRKRANPHTHPIVMSAPEWTPLGDVSEKDYLCVPFIRDTVSPSVIDLSPYAGSNRAIKSIELDELTAYVIGLWVGDGYADNYRTYLCFGDKKIPILARVREWAERSGYAMGSCDRNQLGSAFRVGIAGLCFGRWLNDFCGKGAKQKRIPQIILRHSDPKIRRAFLAGLLDTDGHIDKKGKNYVSTVSDFLYQDLVLLLAQEKIGAAVSLMERGERQIGERVLTTPLRLFVVSWRDSIKATPRVMNGHTIMCSSQRFRVDEWGVWYPVRSIERVSYEGPVYNLTTPDHTYIASGFEVHNCDYAINLIIDDYAKDKHTIELPPGCLLDQKYRDMPWERIYNMLPDSPPPQGGGRGKGKGKGDGNPMPGDCLFQPCDTATDKQAAEQEAAEWQGRLVQADQAARMQGKQSASLSRLVGELIAPKLPWRQLLRRFLTEKVKNDYDWMKPDRRFHDVYLPTLGDEEAAGEIVVAVDTSGSINGTVISAFFSEIDAIHKDLRPTKLTAVYCDAEVHEPADEFGPEDRIVANPKGGGGTSFEPVFNWLEEHHRTPQVLVYLTDLYGDFPAAPPHYPVLWACWSKVDSVPFGEVINVDE